MVPEQRALPAPLMGMFMPTHWGMSDSICPSWTRTQLCCPHFQTCRNANRDLDPVVTTMLLLQPQIRAFSVLGNAGVVGWRFCPPRSPVQSRRAQTHSVPQKVYVSQMHVRHTELIPKTVVTSFLHKLIWVMVRNRGHPGRVISRRAVKGDSDGGGFRHVVKHLVEANFKMIRNRKNGIKIQLGKTDTEYRIQ